MSAFFPSIFPVDLAASLVLAAGASCRARAWGSHLTGAVVLGCLAGLTTPLLRECLLGASGKEVLGHGSYLAAVVLGAWAGALVASVWPRRDQLFFWLDAVALGLAVGVSTVRGMASGVGVSGALLVGVLAALGSGLVRDVALGDTAQAVDESFYATAAIMGSVATMALFYVDFVPGWSDLHCMLGGACVVVALRAWRRSRGLGA